MMASGTYVRGVLSQAVYWIAYPLKTAVSRLGLAYSAWSGPILEVWGDAALMPYTHVSFEVAPTQMLSLRPRMTVFFFVGETTVTRELEYISPYFREVTCEFDTVDGSPHVTAINTCAHNNRPKSLACENLTFEKVYGRAGVGVTVSPHRRSIPDPGGGWTDAELEGAMHKFWSGYSDAPDWAIWTLFATRYTQAGVLGLMFDDSDQNQRQGCAVFTQTLDDYVSSQHDPQPAEHQARMRFFDVVHENGHCFNLHHAWLLYNYDLKWPFFDDLSTIATFMNYPERVNNFWGQFEYRFHDSELKFLRHAPDNFVEMGDAPFYGGRDNFYEPDRGTAMRPWKLEIALHRPRGVFEFLEPVTLTATLTNISGHPQVIDEAVLQDAGNFSLLIGHVDARTRLWRPFVQRCFLHRPRIFEDGQSLSASFFAAAGVDGWYFAEPGAYTIQGALRTSEAIYATSVSRLRIAQPRGWDEEVVAQDFFRRDVARALAFGTTPSRSGAVETLRDIVERFPGRAVSRYAAIALARSSVRDHRVLRGASDKDRGFDVVPADLKTARRLIQRALFDDPEAAAESFGRDAYRSLVEQYRPDLEQKRDRKR
jgi:hypothetical protein